MEDIENNENRNADLLRLFKNAYKRGNYKKAVDLINPIIKYYDETGLSQKKEFAQHLHNFALAYDKCDKLEDALFYYEQSRKMKKHFNYSKESIGKTVNNLGLICYELRKWEEGIDAHKESLEIRKDIFGSDSDEVINSLYHIANSYRCMKKYEYAIKYYDECLVIMNIKNENTTNIEFCEIYEDIGVCCQYWNNYSRAISAFEMALYFLEKEKKYSLDKDREFKYYEKYEAYRHRLVSLNEQCGFIEKAYNYYKEIINDKKYDEYNEDTLGYLFTYSKFGIFCSENDYTTEAIDVLKKCHTVATKLLDSSHEINSEILIKLALSFAYNNEYDNAIKCTNLLMKYAVENDKEDFEIAQLYTFFAEIEHIFENYKNALGFFEKAYLINSKGVQGSRTLKMMAYIYSELDAYYASISCLKESAHILERMNRNVFDKVLSKAYTALSELEFDEGDYEKSIFSLKKAEAFCTNNQYQNEFDPIYIDVLKKQAIVYNKLNNMQEAIKYMKDVHIKQIKSISVESKSYIETLELLAEYSNKNGDYKEALKYFEKLENIKSADIFNDEQELNGEEIEGRFAKKNSYATTLLGKIFALTNLGKYEEAEKTFKKAIKIQKDTGLEMEEKYEEMYIKYYQILSFKPDDYEERKIEVSRIMKKRRERSVNPKRRINYKKNLEILESIYEEADQIEDKTIADMRKVNASLGISGLARKLGDKDYELNSLKRIYEIAKNTDIVNIPMLMGNVSIVTNNYEEAFANFLNAKKNAELNNYEKSVEYCDILFFFGEWHVLNSDYQTANIYFEKWHALYTELKLPIYSQYEKKITKIAKINMSIKNYIVAKKYYLELIKCAEYEKNEFKHLNAIFKLVQVLIILNGNRNIIHRLMEDAKKIVKNIENDSKKSIVLNEKMCLVYDKIGRLYALINEYEQSFRMFEIAYNKSFSNEKFLSKDGYIMFLSVLEKLKYYDIRDKVKKNEKI